MKIISIILGMAGLLGTLQARPQGELSDGKAQSIAGLGVRLTPPAGMKTILAGETEPVNYAFPWFQGKDGHINLATVPKSLDDPQLDKAVAKHLAHPKSPFKLQGEVQPIQLKSGIAALRAELTGKTDPGLQVIRIYFKTRQGSTGYIHILPTPGQSQVLETAVRSTLAHGTATPADLPKDLQKNIGGQTGTPQAAETIIPPKINLLLATLKKGMTQDELTTRIKQYYPESYLAESAGGLANQVLTYRLAQGGKALHELSMHVTNHKEGWRLKFEKFTLYGAAYNRVVVIESKPVHAENPKP